eukprot:1397000-Rhodomonas_salina.1
MISSAVTINRFSWYQDKWKSKYFAGSSSFKNIPRKSQYQRGAKISAREVLKSVPVRFCYVLRQISTGHIIYTTPRQYRAFRREVPVAVVQSVCRRGSRGPAGSTIRPSQYRTCRRARVGR